MKKDASSTFHPLYLLRNIYIIYGCMVISDKRHTCLCIPGGPLTHIITQNVMGTRDDELAGIVLNFRMTGGYPLFTQPFHRLIQPRMRMLDICQRIIHVLC